MRQAAQLPGQIGADWMTCGTPQEQICAPAGVFPVSSMQENLWLLEQMAPGNSAYNLAEAWRLRGPLEVPALQQSFNALASRHETLRTVFGTRSGKPFQLVLQKASFAFSCVDQAQCANPEIELTERLQDEARRPFDLSTGPLARAVLYRLGPCDHVLLICLHHIISDEWSYGVLLRELADNYHGFATGNRALAPELPIQYADFAVWQRELLAGKALDEDLNYWKQQLRAPLPIVTLPADHPRPARASLNGKTQFSTLPGPLVQSLKDLSRRNGVTLFMTLLGAFNTLLYRYTRQTDLIVGSPIAGRASIETENLIGLFVNLHALRTDLSGDPTFTELLTRVREVVLGAYAHQTPPLDKIVETVHPERDAGRHPLFQIVFGLQPALSEQWNLAGIDASRIEIDNGGAKFDWTLLVTETTQGLRVRSEYNSDLFEPETMERVLRQFNTLLEAVALDPSRNISRLPLITHAERQSLLLQANAGTVNLSPKLSDGCLHQLFEKRAGEAPGALALSMGEERLTYRELDERANQLANHLIEAGVGPEVPVGLCLDRSIDLVIAILGILKAGGAYVPIDPATPRERLGFILEDTATPIVITQERLRPHLEGLASRMIFIDSQREAIAAESKQAVENRTQPQNAAYIIYTSGSTGQPKGVLVTHRNVVRLFQQTDQWFDFGPGDVWTLFHSCTFDFSVWELWGALLYGGRLVIVPYLVSRSPDDFYRLLAREKVTVLNQTPSAFRQLIWAETSGSPQPLSLRYVICGGEALELQSLKPWFQRHGDEAPAIVNMYGITETTVHVTYRRIRESDLRNALGSVIGIPIPDLNLFLLDEHLEPVPLGVAGEICVGGAGLARGYLNRPELTCKRFVPHPFVAESGARLYRSGDLARRTSSGELEYLGRMDQQVKIRGFRVELGEIESALNSHPAIRESVVLAHEAPGGDKRLVAYFVPVSAAPANQELRDHLGQRLPDYMVPGIYVPLESMPLTNNGKVDRRALPEPLSNTVEARTTIQPRNEIESLILQMWCAVLGHSGISMDDNFFHIGGHSLMATQVISRIQAALNIELSVIALFESPTIAGLARAVAKAKSEPAILSQPITPRLKPQTAERLLSRLTELTDAEVERLLADTPGKTLLS